MSRHAVIFRREREVAAAARAPDPTSGRAARRRRFIRIERLSLPEASALPDGFDPGPEYDLPTDQEPRP